MTTIACKDGIMCSDSQATREDMIDSLTEVKIFEINGCLIGCSGDTIDGASFLNWFEENENFNKASGKYPSVSMTPPKGLVDARFHCLVLYPDHTMYEHYGCGGSEKVVTKTIALGSGRSYALAAMDAGVSAERAVEVAIGRDVYSGGAVQVFNIDDINNKDERNEEEKYSQQKVTTTETSPKDLSQEKTSTLEKELDSVVVLSED